MVSHVFTRPTKAEYDKEIAKAKKEAAAEMKKMKAAMGGMGGLSGMMNGMMDMADGMVEDMPYFTVNASSCWIESAFRRQVKIYGFRYRTPKGNSKEFATEAIVDVDGKKVAKAVFKNPKPEGNAFVHYRFHEPVTCDRMRFTFSNSGKSNLTVGVVKFYLDPAEMNALKSEFPMPSMQDMMGGAGMGGPPGECPM